VRSSVKEILEGEYNLRNPQLGEASQGWATTVFRISAQGGDYFLKVYDTEKPSARYWVQKIDTYMPLVFWLWERTSLREHMVVPILTRSGLFRAQDSRYVYLLYPFLEGETLGEGLLTPEQGRLFARLVACLHTQGTRYPGQTAELQERFDPSFCTGLPERFRELCRDQSLDKALSPNLGKIIFAVHTLRQWAEALRGAGLPFSLCHTDLHGGNLMRGSTLYLLDWEGLTLAPAEADLFALTEGFFFDSLWHDFYAVYQRERPGFQVNRTALAYYRLRRRLEDIAAFTDSLLLDALDPNATEKTLLYLLRECDKLDPCADCTFLL